MAAPTCKRGNVWFAAATSPTAAEKAPTYRAGEFWARLDTQKVWLLIDDGAGTWVLLN